MTFRNGISIIFLDQIMKKFWVLFTSITPIILNEFLQIFLINFMLIVLKVSI